MLRRVNDNYYDSRWAINNMLVFYFLRLYSAINTKLVHSTNNPMFRLFQHISPSPKIAYFGLIQKRIELQYWTTIVRPAAAPTDTISSEHPPYRSGWCNGRAFAWGSEGCGFDPQPRHTKSRKKMVQVAPLLTLGIER